MDAPQAGRSNVTDGGYIERLRWDEPTDETTPVGLVSSHQRLDATIETCFDSLTRLEQRLDVALIAGQDSRDVVVDDEMKPTPKSQAMHLVSNAERRVRGLAVRIDSLTGRVDI